MVSCTISDEGRQTIYKLGKHFFRMRKILAVVSQILSSHVRKIFMGAFYFSFSSPKPIDLFLVILQLRNNYLRFL